MNGDPEAVPDQHPANNGSGGDHYDSRYLRMAPAHPDTVAGNPESSYGRVN